ncbi:MAG: beta family protein [Pseudogulbenkiania sp.]|nr:beta family protein [Pseudogulbenkiania sp.]
MTEHQHYVPILKMKRGELEALSNATAVVKGRVTPLLEVLLGIDAENPAPEESLQALDNKLQRVPEKWGERSVFLDFRYAEAELGGVPNPAFANIVVAHVPAAIPVLYLGMDPAYQAQQIALIHRLGNGCCIRVSVEDLPAYEANLIQLIQVTELPVEAIDLVFDLTSIYGQAVNLVQLSTSVLLTQTPLNGYRSITLAASAFPELLSQEVGRNDVALVSRVEWGNWQWAVSYCHERGIRKPRFGDYSINYPDLPEGDVTWQSAPNLRYTLDDHWYIAKGQSPKNHPLGNRQFHDICATLLVSGHYAGLGFSWGDDEIHAYGTGSPVRGNSNAETWRKLGFSHHFAKVISQL